MTSNAAAEEIQQIIKSEKTSKNSDKSEIIKIEPINTKIKELPKKIGEILEAEEVKETVFQDEYSGAIEFLQSPITETFLTDIRSQLKVEFEKSFLNLKAYEVLEKETEKRKKINEDQKLQQQTLATLKTAVLERLSTIFLPEFLNRLDDIIIFQPLKPEELRKICDIMVKDVTERVKVKQILLSVDENVKVKLTSEGYNPIFGARPLRRLITKYIEDLISETILRIPSVKKMRTIKIQLNENDQIEVQKEEEENQEF
jgi:ATP-dependent Clp protease ATP-binding subunit ClpA